MKSTSVWKVVAPLIAVSAIFLGAWILNGPINGVEAAREHMGLLVASVIFALLTALGAYITKRSMR
jgi:hypothetical protein